MTQHKNQGKLKGKEQEIIHDYIVNKVGYDSLGKKHDVSGNSILKLLVKHGVQIRTKKVVSINDVERIIFLYTVEKKTMDEVASIIGITASGVFRILRKAKVQTRSVGEAIRQYQLDEHFFDIIDTEEKAYFLGFLYADGCNQMDNFWSTVLSLDVIDQDILHKFASLVYKDPDDAKAQVKTQNREHEGKGIEISLYMNSKHMCQQMQKLGCVSHKTFLLEYPQWMPEHLHRHFIRGYFDGDGTINNESEMVSGCKIVSTLQFLERVKYIANIDGNVYKDNKTNDKNTYYLVYSGNRNQWLFLHWIYSGATIYLQRKYDAYLRFTEKMRVIDEKTQLGAQGYRKSNLPKTSSIKDQ